MAIYTEKVITNIRIVPEILNIEVSERLVIVRDGVEIPGKKQNTFTLVPGEDLNVRYKDRKVPWAVKQAIAGFHVKTVRDRHNAQVAYGKAERATAEAVLAREAAISAKAEAYQKRTEAKTAHDAAVVLRKDTDKALELKTQAIEAYDIAVISEIQEDINNALELMNQATTAHAAAIVSDEAINTAFELKTQAIETHQISVLMHTEAVQAASDSEDVTQAAREARDIARQVHEDFIEAEG